MRLDYLFSLVLITAGAIMCWFFWEEYLVRAWAQFMTTPAILFSSGLFVFVLTTIPVLFGIGLIMVGILLAIVSYATSDIAELDGQVDQSPRGTFCENCGNPLKPTTKFCGSCGNQV